MLMLFMFERTIWYLIGQPKKVRILYSLGALAYIGSGSLEAPPAD